jgi:hypothetical protein
LKLFCFLYNPLALRLLRTLLLFQLDCTTCPRRFHHECAPLDARVDPENTDHWRCMTCLDDDAKGASSSSSSSSAAAGAAAAAAMRVQAVKACHKRLKGATATFLLENASAVQPFVPPALFKQLTAGAAAAAAAAADGGGGSQGKENKSGSKAGNAKRSVVKRAPGSRDSASAAVVIPAIGAGGASFVQAEMRPYQIDGVNWMLSQVCYKILHTM